MKLSTIELATRIVTLITIFLGITARAQLVADGATASINGISTNITGNLLIGDSGSFTTLIITNAGVVTNTGTGIIGNASTAKTNRVIVTGTNSLWGNNNALAIGASGSFNQLLITNGGRVVNAFGNLGNNSLSSNNAVVVTGPGSRWTNSQNLLVGNGGSFNLVLVTNGGRVSGNIVHIGGISMASNNTLIVTGAGSSLTNNHIRIGSSGSMNRLIITHGGIVDSEYAYIGAGPAESGNNSVLVMGAESLWRTRAGADFLLGMSNSFNRLTVTNGGKSINQDSYLGYHLTSRSNMATITGTNSLWTNRINLYVGNSGALNQLIVTNGGKVVNDNAYLGYNPTSSNNTATVTGGDSRWTNYGSLYIGHLGSFNRLLVTNDGRVETTAGLYMGFDAVSSNNTVTLAGGSMFIGNPAFAGQCVADVRRGTFTFDSGLLQIEHLLVTNGAQGNFNFNGGTLRVSRTDITNGSTFFLGNGASAATFDLRSGGPHNFRNGLRIGNAALLKGRGFIHGDITNASGGTLSPGALSPIPSIGRFTGYSNLVLTAGSTNIFEVYKTQNTNDSFVGLTSVAFGGTLVVTNLGGTLTNGDSFTLFAASNYIGTFDRMILPTLGAGLRWSTNGLVVDGTLRVILDTPPSIQIVRIGTNVTFIATNGVPFDLVWLLTATNVTTPETNWTFLATNNFGGTGTANFTIGIAPDDPQRYFRLQVK